MSLLVKPRYTRSASSDQAFNHPQPSNKKKEILGFQMKSAQGPSVWAAHKPQALGWWHSGTGAFCHGNDRGLKPPRGF